MKFKVSHMITAEPYLKLTKTRLPIDVNVSVFTLRAVPRREEYACKPYCYLTDYQYDVRAVVMWYPDIHRSLDMEGGW